MRNALGRSYGKASVWGFSLTLDGIQCRVGEGKGYECYVYER